MSAGHFYDIRKSLKCHRKVGWELRGLYFNVHLIPVTFQVRGAWKPPGLLRQPEPPAAIPVTAPGL